MSDSTVLPSEVNVTPWLTPRISVAFNAEISNYCPATPNRGFNTHRSENIARVEIRAGTAAA